MNPERVMIPDDIHGNDPFIFFGKKVPCFNASFHQRTLIHRDYPCVTGDSMSTFEAMAKQVKKISVTACFCDVHPYRLMSINESGYERYIVDVEREIRGRRQRYPAVYTIKPALIFLPSEMDFRRTPDEPDLNLVIMDREMLLDRTHFLENILLDIHKNF